MADAPYTLGEACGLWTNVAAMRLACAAISNLSGAPNYASDALITTEIGVATDLLYVLSGRQFSGACTEVVRPCRRDNCYGFIGFVPWGTGTYGTVTDPSSWPPQPCGCSRIPTIDMGYWPITEITEVKIDGEVVDPTTYRLDNNRHLVRLAASPDWVNDGWPTCQHLDRPDTAEGTFQVSFTRGIAPPNGGVNAVKHLTCELLKAATGQACQLPGRVTSVNRQQLSFTMINASMLNDGLTGLYDVDLFIIAYNPHKQRGSALVWSPDLDNKSYRAGN